MKKYLKNIFNLFLIIFITIIFLMVCVYMIDFSVFTEDFTNIYNPY